MNEQIDLPALADDVYSRLKLDGLTRRQRLFILKFDGRRPVEVAADAGFKNPESAVSRLMTDPKIQANLDIIRQALEQAHVASALEVLMFWSQLMHNLEADPKDRLAASDKLGKFHKLIAHGNTTHIDNRTLEISILGVGHVLDENGQPKQIDGTIIDVPPGLEDLL